MLKIEKESDGPTTIVRLRGRVQSAHIDDIRLQMGEDNHTILDLSDVTLVDVEVVRFLSGCGKAGIELANCPSYVHEWMPREQARGRG